MSLDWILYSFLWNISLIVCVVWLFFFGEMCFNVFGCWFLILFRKLMLVFVLLGSYGLMWVFFVCILDWNLFNCVRMWWLVLLLLFILSYIICWEWNWFGSKVVNGFFSLMFLMDLIYMWKWIIKKCLDFWLIMCLFYVGMLFFFCCILMKVWLVVGKSFVCIIILLLFIS